MVDANDYISKVEDLMMELGYRIGKPIHHVNGVTVLATSANVRWIIEAPSDTELMFIHSPLISEANLEAKDGLDILAQNARLEFLRGSWLALDRQEGMLELCAQCPISFLNVQMLENMLVHLIEIRAEVIKTIEVMRMGRQADDVKTQPNGVDGLETAAEMIGV